MQAYKKRGFWIGLAAFFFVLLTPNPESLSPIGWAVAAVTLLMAIWWATEAVPVAVTALLPLALFPMLHVTDFKTAALPYANPNIYLFTEEQMLPAAAQGAIGIEINAHNVRSEIAHLLESINDRRTHEATEIERTIVASLEGHCLSPISALCKINDQDVELKVRVSSKDGSEVYNEMILFKLENKINSLRDFTETLIRNGAKEIIQR